MEDQKPSARPSARPITPIPKQESALERMGVATEKKPSITVEQKMWSFTRLILNGLFVYLFWNVSFGTLQQTELNIFNEVVVVGYCSFGEGGDCSDTWGARILAMVFGLLSSAIFLRGIAIRLARKY